MAHRTYRVETTVTMMPYVRADSLTEARARAGTFDIRDVWHRMRSYAFARQLVVEATTPSYALGFADMTPSTPAEGGQA